MSEFEATEALLPPGINAARCLSVRSSVGGADAHHAAELIDSIASLGCDDLKEIARSALETAAVTAMPSDYSGNDAITFIITS